METKSDTIWRLWILFFIATAFLTAGWFMKSSPLSIFAGIAPLFGIAERAEQNENFWGSSELILTALTVSFFGAHFFELSSLAGSISQAIALTLAFVGYAYVQQNLNLRLGKLTIVIFWLGIEYAFLKLPLRDSVLFLGDVLQGKSMWLRWNRYTGYLGSSAWVLICNLLLYRAMIRKDQRAKGVWLVVALISIVGPMTFSYAMNGEAIKRSEMISAYQDTAPSANANSFFKDEIVARTAAILSVLILLLTLARTKTQKSK